MSGKIDQLYRLAVRVVNPPTNKDIVNLAALIWDKRQLDLGPILADALEDEGFNCGESLAELRSGDFGLSHRVIYKLNVKE